MTETVTLDAYGTLIEPTTLKIQRLLPGPIERVWSYLVDSDLRRQWLAAGQMEMKADTPFEFVWRNNELTDPPGEKPAGFSDEHRMQSRIVTFDPPRKLVFTWGASGEVSFDLDLAGSKVLLTVIHRRLPDRTNTVNIGAGWHRHLDVLVARITGEDPGPFWDGWVSLRKDYDGRVPA